MLWKRVAANAGKALKWCRFPAENRCQFASERPDMTVLAKETAARLAASFEVRIFPHGGASASVSIMKRTDGPKQFSKLHIFTQMNPLCREIFSCCGKIVFTDVSLSQTHLLSPCTNSFLPRRQSFPKTFQRTPSQRQAHRLPETDVSAPRCGRIWEQIRACLVPDSVASRPAFADG